MSLYVPPSLIAANFDGVTEEEHLTALTAFYQANNPDRVAQVGGSAARIRRSVQCAVCSVQSAVVGVIPSVSVSLALPHAAL